VWGSVAHVPDDRFEAFRGPCLLEGSGLMSLDCHGRPAEIVWIPSPVEYIIA